MADIWPLDAKRNLSTFAKNSIRPFKCLLLMPFEGRFRQIAEVIKETVEEAAKNFSQVFNLDLPEIKRLDWVTSTGVIHQELWKEIEEADLVFCDITGYNPNVMFELGVCAAWKEIKQVVLIKDHYFKQESAFDIAPIRYTEYQLTSDGIEIFKGMVKKHTINVLIGFPDLEGSRPILTFPLKINFKENRDDLRLYTPPFAHRRVIDESLEFGSRSHYPHSWASVGKRSFLNFSIEFSARFSNPVPGHGFIGVGLRSQHFYAGYGHIIYLNHEGQITIAQPTDQPPHFYEDVVLRSKTPIDLMSYHDFQIAFSESGLDIRIDDFHRILSVGDIKKVLGPGLIRFQSHMSWMVIRQLTVNLHMISRVHCGRIIYTFR